MPIQLRNLLFLCLSLFFGSSLFADSHVVNSGSYYYSPSSLTINSGDTVYWYNDGGFHNVNGEVSSITGEDYGNPESFVSGATNTVGALTYMHVFNVPGIYNYDCSVGSHAVNGMLGSINVLYQNPQEPTAVNPVEITFKVNMQDQEVNPTGVFMAGGPWQVSNNSDLGYTASGLSGGTTPGFLMNDDDGDGIWELTLSLEEGSEFYWKFRNGYYSNLAADGAWEGNFSGQGCGYWDNGDRKLVVPSQESSYDFCFNSCDAQCLLPPQGCMDATACNYDELAEQQPEGACDYPAEGFDCEGNCLSGDTYVLSLFDSYGDGWTGGLLTVDGLDYNLVYGDSTDYTLCLDTSQCYEVIYTAGQWSSENSWQIADASGTVITAAFNFSGSFGACGIYGCKDQNATNYNELAQLENGSCVYPISMAVELDYNVSSTICGYSDDYNSANGEDMAYHFNASNGIVEVSMIQEEAGTGQPYVFVFDGNPVDSTTVAVASQFSFWTGDSMTFESNDSTTYYVVIDALADWGCFAYDLTITQHEYLGCTETTALNYDETATFDDGSCYFEFDDCETAFYCEDFETVTAPAIPNGMTTISAEDNYYVPSPGAGSVTPGAGVLVSGFYTGNGDDANVAGFLPIGEHTQFAMTNDDACLPTNSVPNEYNNCDLSLERLILPTLDFTGQEGMWIQFEYYHDGNYGGGDANLELSLDGGTTWLEINDEPLATGETWQTAAFDLSAYDNSPSVTIRITWSDNNNWVSGFAVDDIVVNPLLEYGMIMIDKQHFFPSQYFGETSYNDVPLVQASATAYNFMGYLKNLGFNTLDSARLYASITSEGFSTESFGINTVSLGQDTFYCNDVFTATELGTYTADIYGASDNNLTTPTEGVSFNVTEFDYSRDLAGTGNSYTGGSFINHQGSEQRGNIFDIYADSDLHAIKVRIHPSTSPNSMAKAVLNSVDITTGDVSFLTETSLKNVGAYTDDWYNFVFDSPIPLAAGEVVLATILAEYNGVDTLVLATNGQTAQGETLLQDIDGVLNSGAVGDWYYTTSAVMVRLNFDPNVVDVSLSWVCVENSCFDPQDGSGNYQSLEECEVGCGTSTGSITNTSITGSIICNGDTEFVDIGFLNLANNNTYELWIWKDNGSGNFSELTTIIEDFTNNSNFSSSGNVGTYNFGFVNNGNYKIELKANSGYLLDVSFHETYEWPPQTGIIFLNNGSNTILECNGDNDGSLKIMVTGGVPPFSFSWTGPNGYTSSNYDGSVISEITNLAGGEYNLILIDGNGCDNNSFSATISEPDVQITNSNIIYNATSLDDCDGVVITQTFGGTPPYSYNWNGIDTDYIANLCDGNNILIITDNIGCQLVDTVFIGPVSLGCIDLNACNFSEIANTDDGSCTYPDSIYDCFENCYNDYDFDGVCDELEIYGCIDENAPNYDELATDDDGSCIECNISVEYILYNSSNNIECDGLIGLIINNQVDYIAYINNEALNTNYYTEACSEENIIFIQDDLGCIYNDIVIVEANNIYGCTDSDAGNYNPEATFDDGSCISPQLACEITPVGLFVDNIIHERVVFNWDSPTVAPSYYMIRYRAVGTSSWTVMSAGPQNNLPFEGTSRTRYFMEPNTTYQWNIRARDIDHNGTTICQSPWSESSQYTTLPNCANLESLSVAAESNWVTLNADSPDGNWGVWQSKAKMKELGTNSFRYANGDSYGNINVLKGNFTPNTQYEWHTKAWCTGNVDEDGNSDLQYHSGWGDFSTFSTEDSCDKLPTNLNTATNNNQNQVIMTWDTPDSGAPDHYFLELTNETTGQTWAWNAIAGNLNSQIKYGQTLGNNYSWRIRGACGTNGTSWATSFTSPIYYTLGGERTDDNTISSLEVFPNPSKGLFSISFESKESQNIEISITNYLGEKVFKQEVSNLINTYNRTIDLSNKANGIYLLSIKTNNKIFNKKIVIQ